MFDKIKFAKIISNINNTYNTMTEFAEKTGVNRTYLSQYINLKLDSPPSPKILMKIANSSNKATNYEELMLACGYLEKDMQIDEMSKKIFYNYLPALKKLKLDDNLLDIMYKMDLEDSSKYKNQFNILVSRLPEETKKRIYEINSKILSETNKIMENTINSISIRTKYNIEDNITNKLFNVPILGKITAGQPILAEENLEGYLPVDPNIYGMTTPNDYFYLKVSGDSMNLKVQDGDYVLIHKQDYAKNGDIIVAIVNGDDEATLKRYKEINKQFIQLEPMSNNPTHENRTIDLKETKFQVIGNAIGKFGKF